MQKQKSVIFNNTITSMAQILRGMAQLWNIPFNDPRSEVGPQWCLGAGSQWWNELIFSHKPASYSTS